MIGRRPPAIDHPADSNGDPASARTPGLAVDVGLWGDIADAGPRARDLESVGYDAIYVPETGHDPFLPIVSAAATTERIGFRTGVAVALPRSPTHLAMVANDLQLLSRGRFQLGLGTQVRAHVERRFGATWTNPIGRMRDLVHAVRAVQQAWETGERLDFHSTHYDLTLMTPFFSPGPNPYGPPPIYMAALGPRMTELAGEVADGVLPHGLTSGRFFREVTLPALERGLATSGRRREDIELNYPNLIASGDDDAELEAAMGALRSHLAFYASTPTYRVVLDSHGWGDLQRDLHALARADRWSEMGALVTDEVLDAFTVFGTPDEVAARIVERAAGIADRVSFFSPAAISLERMRDIVTEIKRRSAPTVR